MINLKLLDKIDIRKSIIFKLMGLEGKETAFSVVRKNKIKNDYIGWAAHEYDAYTVDVLAIQPHKAVKVNEENPLLGLRPSVRYSDIEDLCENHIVNEKGVLEVEFGEYPQSKIEKEQKSLLDALYLTGELDETGKTYKIFNKEVDFYNDGPTLREDNSETFLIIKELVDKDGNKYVKRENDWFKVEPIKWYVDLDNNIAITEKILTGGIPYGKYELVKLTPEEEKRERLHPKKLSLANVMTDAYRRRNPEIIEGYLNIILSKDIIKSDEKDYRKSNESSPKQKQLRK